MAQVQRRRPWLAIGPGVILALLIAALIVAKVMQRSPGRPIVEREVVADPVRTTGGSGHEIGLILDHEKDLGLTSIQMDSLRKLDVEWKRRSDPLRVEMSTAAGEFRRYVERGPKRPSIRDIESHAAPVSELSRQWGSLRRVYWEKALPVLDARQRKGIEEIAKRHPTDREENRK